jgi:hypothetical protein
MSTVERAHRIRTALVVLPLACVACPGTLDDPGRFADGAGLSGCPDLPTRVFATTCAKSGCHSAADKAQGMDLESPDVVSRLVGVSSTEGSGLLIDPSMPMGSLLYRKLTPVPPFGSRMPLGAKPLDDSTMACVLAWISENAGDAAPSEDGGPSDDAGTGATDAGGANTDSSNVGADAASVPGADASSSDGGRTDSGLREGGATDAAHDANRPEASSGSPDAGSG